MDFRVARMRKISYIPLLRRLQKLVEARPPALAAERGLFNEDDFGETSIIAPLPAPQLPAFVPFVPPAPDAARAALEQFYAARPCNVRLSPETDLPTRLVGLQLQSPRPWTGAEFSKQLIASADAFMQENALMLSGLSGSDQEALRTTAVQASVWRDTRGQVTVEQTNRQGVPLYGATLVCSYARPPSTDQAALISVRSTLYPALPSEIDALQWLPLPWEDSSGAFLRNLPDAIKPRRFEPPPNFRGQQGPAEPWILPRPVDTGVRAVRDLPGQPELRDGWWFLPWPFGATRNGSAGEQQRFRPVWRVVIVDQDEQDWLALVDAEQAVVLQLKLLTVHASVRAMVFMATAGQPCAPPPIAEMPLDFGQGINSIGAANRVHISGPRFADPTDPNADQAARELSATAYYHATRMQDHIKAMFGLLGLQLWLSNALNNPSPTDEIAIKLSDAAGSAAFRPAQRIVEIFSGEPGVPGGSPAVAAPGQDSAVLCHEFIHALDRHLNPSFYHFTSSTQRTQTRGVDEGLAFYLACDAAGGPVWASCAYSAWVDGAGAPSFNLAAGSITHAQAVSSAHLGADETHRLGVFWGRLFWSLRQSLGPDQANLILWQAFKLGASPVNSVEDFAERLMDQAVDDPAEEALIRGVLSSFGVALP